MLKQCWQPVLKASTYMPWVLTLIQGEAKVPSCTPRLNRKKSQFRLRQDDILAQGQEKGVRKRG